MHSMTLMQSPINDCLQIRGGTPDGPNPGKVGEGIAQNINGPDPKGAASKVCHPCSHWCISLQLRSLLLIHTFTWVLLQPKLGSLIKNKSACSNKPLICMLCQSPAGLNVSASVFLTLFILQWSGSSHTASMPLQLLMLYLV